MEYVYDDKEYVSTKYIFGYIDYWHTEIYEYKIYVINFKNDDELKVKYEQFLKLPRHPYISLEDLKEMMNKTHKDIDYNNGAFYNFAKMDYYNMYATINGIKCLIDIDTFNEVINERMHNDLGINTRQFTYHTNEPYEIKQFQSKNGHEIIENGKTILNVEWRKFLIYSIFTINSQHNISYLSINII